MALYYSIIILLIKFKVFLQVFKYKIYVSQLKNDFGLTTDFITEFMILLISQCKKDPKAILRIGSLLVIQQIR